jgi:hypothetical protein
MSLTSLYRELDEELSSAQRKFPRMHGPHEGWAVLREEVDELWEDVKANRGRGPEARKEALQAAAMAMRYIIDVSD